MMPNIAPPTAEDLARVLDTHADRFPEKREIGPLVGDRGKRVKLPIVVGNPRAGSPAFNQAVAVALNFQRTDDPNGEELVKECLLWPPRPLWNEWRARWAALDGRVATALGRKLGSTLEVLEEPAESDEPPEGIAPTDSGVWRILKPEGAPLVYVAIEPPDDIAWRMFVAAASKRDADVVALAHGLATGCVKQSTRPIEELFVRWPGLAVACISVIADLAGAGVEVSLGNW